jgi:hypothetical protein
MAYPKTKYNAAGVAKSVANEAEEAALGPGWADVPQGAKYPKAKYHASHEPRLVHNEAEDAAIGAGWQDTPVDKTKPKDADLITTAHYRYLKSLGYTKIKSMEDAQKWVDALSQADRDKFYVDAKAWEKEDAAINEKLQNANAPKKPTPKTGTLPARTTNPSNLGAPTSQPGVNTPAPDAVQAVAHPEKAEGL